MEINEKNISLKDWKTLEETADTIIANATRDLILWSNVKKEIKKQCQTKIMSKEEEKNTK